MNEGIPVLMRKNVNTEGRLPLKNLSKSFLIKYYFQEYDCFSLRANNQIVENKAFIESISNFKMLTMS